MEPETTNQGQEQNAQNPDPKPETKSDTKPDTAPKPDAPALTAEDVSGMITAALSQLQTEQTEAQKLENMTGQERAEYERDSYKKQLDDLKKQVETARMQRTARNMLAEKGIHLPDELLSSIVTAEADTTKQNVEQFSTLFDRAVEDAVKQRLKGEPPKRGKSGGTLTKADIMKEKDPLKQQKMIQEHMDLF